MPLPPSPNTADQPLIGLAETPILKGLPDLKDVNHSVQIRLRKVVDQLGWSDSEVAQKADLPQSTVYRVLNAKTASPSFAIVQRLCQTLGIGLPFRETANNLIRPIDYFIGHSSMDLIRHEQKRDSVHILPMLQNYKICKVIDDCADRKYPKGALLFMEEFNHQKASLRAGEIVIIQRYKTSTSYLIPMIVLESPLDELGNIQWIFHHLTSNKHKQFIFNAENDAPVVTVNYQKNKIIGRIQKALI